MVKQRLVLILLLVLACLSMLQFNFVPNVRATEDTFQSSDSDGQIYKSSSSYTTAHDILTGTVVDDQTWFLVGQRNDSGTYYIYRSFVFFNTSSIPDDVTITSAKLKLYVDKYSTVNFSVVVQNGQPLYPYDPLTTGSYGYTRYSGDGGNASIASWTCLAWEYITLNADGISWINKTGTTKLCLRSSRDINSTEETETLAYVQFHSSDGGSSYAIQLIVTYYQYTFHGLYDESTGCLNSIGERAVNVTAYFDMEGVETETFEVNGTYLYNTSATPLYFYFELGSYDREYWLSSGEDTATIYIFNDTLTTYTVNFLDIGGILGTYLYVDIQRYVNGSLMTVEKRKVDSEKKIQASLVQGVKYTIEIGNGASYTWGDVLFTSDTTVELTIKGLEFPETIRLGYKYVRIYATRDMSDGVPVTITYQDTLSETTQVVITIYFQSNDSQAYTTTKTSNSSFVVEWNGADNTTDYWCLVVITHASFGVMTYRQVLPRVYSENPWSLPFLGSLLFATNLLIPSFLVLAVFGVFSSLSVKAGMFAGVATATILAYIGWLPIPVEVFVFVWALTIIFALANRGREATVI